MFKFNTYQLDEMLGSLRSAIVHTEPFAVISLGDAENMFYVHPEIEEIEDVERYLKVNGVSTGMVGLKQKSLELMPIADYVFAQAQTLTPQQREALQSGVVWARHFDTWTRVFEKYGINCKIVDQSDKYRMVTNRQLFKTLGSARVLLIGSRAEEVAKKPSDMNVVAWVRCDMMAGYAVDTIVKTALSVEFDVALVSAGVSANYICLRLKQEGRIAIDFGANMDKLAGDILDRTGM